MDMLSPDVIADRLTFLRGLIAAGSLVAGLPRLHRPSSGHKGGLSAGDKAILHAAQAAEALAVTTYDHVILVAPLFARLFPQDQAYMQAARQEEMAHYLLMRKLTGQPTPYQVFYYPKGMFTSGPVTLNTLVALEEAFIAAYLVGVRDFSSPDLRVAAARILGVESDHRTMVRVLAPGLDPQDGGPLRTVTGFKSGPEKVNPSSNNTYERTLGWTRIEDAVAALRPFVDKRAAATAGFSTNRYTFREFTPSLPTPLGGF